MGSRTSPNHGGSGAPHSRITRPNNQITKTFKSEPIKTPAELDLYLSGDKIACLICGGEYKNLGIHLSNSHSIGSKEYKERFNIPVTRSLCGQDLINRKREIMSRAWEENPKMDAVRDLLKKNISNLDGAKHKSKSSIAKQQSQINAIKMKAVQTETINERFRDKYIGIIKEAIEKKCTIYKLFKHTHSIYKFAKAHPDDAEYKELLESVPKPTQAPAGGGKEARLCPRCGETFMARKDRNEKFCPKKCTNGAKMAQNPA